MKMTDTELSAMADAAYELLEAIYDDRATTKISKETVKNHLATVYLHLQKVEEMYDLQQDNIFEEAINGIRAPGESSQTEFISFLPDTKTINNRGA